MVPQGKEGLWEAQVGRSLRRSGIQCLSKGGLWLDTFCF